MTKTSREGRQRFQVNVPLDDEHWHIVLLQLAIREGRTVPELLRPVIIRYLKRQLSADAQLAAAVTSMEESKVAASRKERRRRRLAEVKEIPGNNRNRSERGRPGLEQRPKPPPGK